METIDIIETNIDDMNPEIYPHVIDRLMESGALDAYITNIIMKKGRPAIKLSVLASQKDTERLSNIIFDETTSIGIRIFSAERKILTREIKEVKTKYGKIRVKISKSGGEIKNIMPEFEDCRKAAGKFKVPLKRVYEEIKNHAPLEGL